MARYVDTVFVPLPLLLRLAAVAASGDATAAPESPGGDTPTSSAALASAAPTSSKATASAAPSATTRPGPRRVTRSLATTAWPVEPAASAGFVLVGDAMVPWAGATAFAPLYFSAGPIVAGRVLGTSTGALDVVEGVVGVGVGWQGHLGEARARASVVPGVLFSQASVETGMVVAPGGTVGMPGCADGACRRVADATSTAVMVPLELALPLGGGVSFTGVVEPTISTKAAYVDDTGVVAYARDRFFVFVGVGLDVGGPVD